MFKLFRHYVWAQQLGPDIDKALDPVLAFIIILLEQQIYVNLCSPLRKHAEINEKYV